MGDFHGVAMLIASSGRKVDMEWALSLPTFGFPVGMSAMWFLCVNTDRAAQREALADQALKSGAEYLFFLDDDTVIPNYTLQQLHYHLNQDPQAAVIGGIYCTKADFPEPLVFKDLGAGVFWEWKVGEVFECKGLGTGCMMIKSSALKTLPKPWFKEPNETPAGQIENYNGIEVPLAKKTGTDDLFFCQKVTDAGFKILAHGGVLPVHIDQNGKKYSLPLDSYPLKDYQAEIAAAQASGKKELVVKG